MMIPRYTQQISIHSILRIPFADKIEFPDNFLFFNSGRGVIKWLMSRQKSVLEKKLNVGIPCYSCYTVYQSVKESENTTILLDINPLCFAFTDKLNDQLKNLDVLIWINYFGFKYISVLKEIRTRFPDLIIVEDCSQVDLRDYLKTFKKDCLSDFAIFSFNFRKPITAGGGGLLIFNLQRNNTGAQSVNDIYSQLSCEKLTVRKIVHILIYNFSYNSLIYFIFNKLISRKRKQKFFPEEIPIKSLIMNEILKSLFYIQYVQKNMKKKSEYYTKNYFNKIPELVESYSFGSLSYFPVLLRGDNKNRVPDYIDKFMLWDNLLQGYKFFNIKIQEEIFPLTFDFLSNTTFFPATYFKDTADKEFVFPNL